MFGGFGGGGLSAKEYGARVNSLGKGSGRGGRSVPSYPSHYRGATTTPLCLYCEQKGFRSNKK